MVSSENRCRCACIGDASICRQRPLEQLARGRTTHQRILRVRCGDNDPFSRRTRQRPKATEVKSTTRAARNDEPLAAIIGASEACDDVRVSIYALVESAISKELECVVHELADSHHPVREQHCGHPIIRRLTLSGALMQTASYHAARMHTPIVSNELGSR